MHNNKYSDIAFSVNGQRYEMSVKNNWTLLTLLRDVLGLTGTKRGCDTGECGACTVVVDGKACSSCLLLAPEVDGKSIITVEGLADDDGLAPVQEFFLQESAYQCGFCTPGFLMAAKALLDVDPRPREEDIREALAGHVCRCGAYGRIMAALTSISRDEER